MLNNPHTGQKVRIAVEYRDEFPVHDLGDREGVIRGIGNFVTVQFEEGRTMHLPAKFLEAAT